MAAYYTLTQLDDTFAALVKEHHFINIIDLMCTHGTAPIPNLYEGEEVTERTGSFFKALDSTVCKWWLGDQAQMSGGFVAKPLTDRSLARAAGPSRDVRVDTSKYSDDPLRIGLWFHNTYGSELCSVAANELMDDMDASEYEFYIPGRVVDPTIPHFGITPDALCSKKQCAFINLLDGVGEFAGGIEAAVAMYTEDEIENGRPRIVLELKSISRHKGQEVSITTEEIVLMFRQCNGLDREDQGKVALELFVSKLGSCGWTQQDLFKAKNGDGSKARFGETLYKKNYSKEGSRFFTKSNLMYPTKQYNRLKQRLKGVDYHVLPSLAQFDKRRHNTKGVQARSKQQKSKLAGKFIKSIDNIVNVGKGVLIVYGTDERKNKPIAKYVYDEAPAMLSFVSRHFTQVLGQHRVLRKYSHTGDTTSVFGVLLLRRDEESREWSLGMVYLYDVGLTGTDTSNIFAGQVQRELLLAIKPQERGYKSFLSDLPVEKDHFLGHDDMWDEV